MASQALVRKLSEYVYPMGFLSSGGGGGSGVTLITTVNPIAGGPITTTGAISVAQFDDAQAGVVPASGGGTANFLRADQTWADPTGGAAFVRLQGSTPGTVDTGNAYLSGTFLTGVIAVGTTTPAASRALTVKDYANGAQITLQGDPTGIGNGPKIEFVNNGVRQYSVGMGYAGTGDFTIRDDTFTTNRLNVVAGGNIGINSDVSPLSQSYDQYSRFLTIQGVAGEKGILELSTDGIAHDAGRTCGQVDFVMPTNIGVNSGGGLVDIRLVSLRGRSELSGTDTKRGGLFEIWVKADDNTIEPRATVAADGTVTATKFAGAATKLRSATTDIDVSAATAPTAGFVLTATSSTAATWQTAGTATSASTVAITNDAATNATMYPTWVTATTGNLPLYTSSSRLSFNPGTGILTVAGHFVGDITGNVTGDVSGNAGTATTATTATNATNTAVTDDTTTNATMYPTWVTTTTGNLPQKLSSTKLTFNPSTGTLTTTTFSGALSGNATTATSATSATSATTATTATNATNVAVTDDTTTNATMYPLWVTANTGNLPAKLSSSKMTFNPSTGSLVSTVFTGPVTALKSATTSVDVSAATAPSANQVLTATDSTHATWVTPGSVGNATSIGAFGSNPGSPASGDLYLCNNAPVMERYNGSTWDRWYRGMPVTKPELPSWAWRNQGTASVSTVLGGVEMAIAYSNNTNDKKIREIAAPGGLPYTVTAAFELNAPNQAYMSGGLYINDGTKVVSLTYPGNGAGGVGTASLAEEYFTTVTASVSSTPKTATTSTIAGLGAGILGNGVMWLRMTENVSNRLWYVSSDGQRWILFFSEAHNANLTATNIGWGGQCYSATSTDVLYVRLVSWLVT